jgi:hypothetical protein
MARIRSIHPSLCTDEIYMSLSLPAKAAWPLIWMECDDQGAFEWKPIVLKARLFPADNIDLAAVLGELETAGAIRQVEIDGKRCGLIRNFCKYQRPKKPLHRFVLTDEMRTFVSSKVKSTEPVTNPLRTPTEEAPQRKEEGGSKKKEENCPKRVRTEYPEDLEDFWKAYPKTPIMSKKETYREWKKLAPENRVEARAALPGFIAFLKANPTHSVVHACRFLSQGRSEGFKPEAPSEKVMADMAARGWVWRENKWQQTDLDEIPEFLRRKKQEAHEAA